MGTAGGGTAGYMDLRQDAVLKSLCPFHLDQSAQKSLGITHTLLADGGTNTGHRFLKAAAGAIRLFAGSCL